MKVIHNKNLPTRFNITNILMMIVFLDWVKAPEWVWAAWITLASIAFIAKCALIWNEEKVDIFKEKKDAN